MIISRDNLGRIISSNGRKPIAIDLNRAVKLYANNYSIREVASLLETNAGVLQRHFKRLGISKDKGWRSRGSQWSDTSRQKASQARTRLLADPVMKERYCMGGNNPFYGRHHKAETISAMKQKLSIIFSGKNNPQWRGGKSLEPYSSEFKRKIRHWIYLRDDYTCQECGIIHLANGGKLVAHHKDADKCNCFMNNLITLCRSCHGKITMVGRWGKEVYDT